MSDNTQAVTPQNTVGVAPGWYPIAEHPGRQGYWNGTQWTQFHDVNTVPQAVPVAVGNSAPVQQVVVHQERKRVNHLLHLVLTVLTVGLWLPVWVILAFAKS